MKSIVFLVFVLFSCFLNGFDVRIQKNTLFSWMNKDNIKEQLFLYKINYNQTTSLKKVEQLPMDFKMEQNCAITNSESLAAILQPVYKFNYHMDFIYLVDNKMKAQGFITFSKAVNLSLSQSLSLKLSKNMFSSQLEQKSTVPLSLQQQSLYLYNYNDLQLYRFQKGLYYTQPICAVFGPMSQSLCLENACQTISVKKFLENQNQKILKVHNYYRNGEHWVIQQNQDINSGNIFYLEFEHSPSNQNQSYDIAKSQIVSSNTNLKLEIRIQNDSPVINLRDDIKKTTEKFIINLKNVQNYHIYNYVKILIGERELFFSLMIFAPFQLKTFVDIWPSILSSQQVVEVQVYDQSLNIIQKALFNHQAGNILAIQQQKKQENQTIFNEYIELIDTLTLKERMTLIIAGCSAGGFILVLIIIACLCRKRIIKKLCGEKVDEAQQKYNQKANSLKNNKDQQIITIMTSNQFLTNPDEMIDEFKIQNQLQNQQKRGERKEIIKITQKAIKVSLKSQIKAKPKTPANNIGGMQIDSSEARITKDKSQSIQNVENISKTSSTAAKSIKSSHLSPQLSENSDQKQKSEKSREQNQIITRDEYIQEVRIEKK